MANISTSSEDLCVFSCQFIFIQPNLFFQPPLYIYIYIYIYIVIHRQISFYQNSSVWLDTQDARSRDRNPSNFTLNCDTDHSSTKRTTLAKGILRYFYFYFLETAAAAAAFVYIFYTLSATRVLNSFEELRITLAAAGNSFARELNLYIYISSSSCRAGSTDIHDPLSPLRSIVHRPR